MGERFEEGCEVTQDQGRECEGSQKSSEFPEEGLNHVPGKAPLRAALLETGNGYVHVKFHQIG
jgi:hypothetical protein